MKKILVIDDSVTSRALFRAFLPKDGSFEVFEAGNSESAILLATKINPEICVLDYNLPGKNGIEIAEEILAICPKTKCILMTANAQKSVLAGANKLGFVAFLEKPLELEKVSNLLRNIL